MTAGRRLGAWVDTVGPEDAEGRLKEAYDWQAQRLGEPTEYTQLGSLHPELVYERLRLYKVIDQLDSGLTDPERQVVIYVTSMLNSTPHCASGARHKLRIVGVADDLVERIIADPFAPATGDPRLDAIVTYTATLTRSPARSPRPTSRACVPSGSPMGTSSPSTTSRPTSATPTGWRPGWACAATSPPSTLLVPRRSEPFFGRPGMGG